MRKAGSHIAESLERPDHQARADQQDERNRDLHDDERSSCAVAFAAVRIVRVPPASAVDRPGRTYFNDRQEPKQQTRENRDGQCEQQDDAVDGDAVLAG